MSAHAFGIDIAHANAAVSLTAIAPPNIRDLLNEIWAAASAAGAKINWLVVMPDLFAIFASLSNPAALAVAVAKLISDIFGANPPAALQAKAAAIAP